MKILVTGATGFLGYRLVERLAAMQDVVSIKASGRSIKKYHYVAHPKVDYILGDMTDKEFVRDLVVDVDYIVHAAALSSPWGKFKDFEKANLTAQKIIVNAALEAGIEKFVFISTPSLYFNNTDRFNIRENEPLPKKFINAYAHTKRLAEIELENASIPYVILRPRALIGRGDTVIMPRLIRANSEGKLRIIGNGDNIVDLTSVDNLVDAILLSLKAEGEGLNETYNISNGAPVKLWQQIQKVLQLLDHKVPTKSIPVPVVQIVARIMEWKSRLTNMKEPALTYYSVGTLAKSFTMDISKAQKLLGYQPRVSTEESIIEFVKWYQQHE